MIISSFLDLLSVRLFILSSKGGINAEFLSILMSIEFFAIHKEEERITF